MRTEKSFKSMVFVMIVSFAMIIASIYMILQINDGSIKFLSYLFVIFLTPVLLYSAILYFKNYKMKSEYKKEDKIIFKLDSKSIAPSLNQRNNQKVKNREKSSALTEIFIEGCPR